MLDLAKVVTEYDVHGDARLIKDQLYSAAVRAVHVVTGKIAQSAARGALGNASYDVQPFDRPARRGVWARPVSQRR